MWNPFRRKEGQVKNLQQPVSRGGWTPMFSYVHEPTPGPGSRTWKLSPKRFSPIMLCFPAYL